MPKYVTKAEETRTDPWQNLANAVVILAVQDYRAALTRLKYSPSDYRAKAAKDELERFFRSEWYCLLTDLDGAVIMEGVQREVNRKGSKHES